MRHIIILILSVLFLYSCSQSDPSFNPTEGDVLTFSRLKWDIKHGNSLLGPGPNYFSNSPSDVWIDDQGFLHLTLHEHNGIWYSTEVVSQDTFAYGTYVFTIQGNLNNIDREMVLGLFTWDNNTFQEQANSEVDIEFSKWRVDTALHTLQYGVQPIAFGDYNPERLDQPNVSSENWNGVSTHAFTWTDTLITWESWLGTEYGNGPPLCGWTFDLDNPARIKYENGNASDPVIIPAPGNTTNARMNLWLLSGPSGPAIKIGREVIIQKFEFIPL